MKNRIFLPQSILDEWVSSERAQLDDRELVVGPERRRYLLVEGIHFLAEVTGQPDPFALVGKVKPRTFVSDLGGEILEGSVLITDFAYDVVTGFLAFPKESLSAYREMVASAHTALVANDARSDEQLMIRWRDS